MIGCNSKRCFRKDSEPNRVPVETRDVNRSRDEQELPAHENDDVGRRAHPSLGYLDVDSCVWAFNPTHDIAKLGCVHLCLPPIIMSQASPTVQLIDKAELIKQGAEAVSLRMIVIAYTCFLVEHHSCSFLIEGIQASRLLPTTFYQMAFKINPTHRINLHNPRQIHPSTPQTPFPQNLPSSDTRYPPYTATYSIRIPIPPSLLESGDNGPRAEDGGYGSGDGRDGMGGWVECEGSARWRC